MYEFTQDCLTGIDQIDEEHRKLFSLINEAVELPKEARTPQTVKNILEHLSDYAVNHFAHEEAYMEAQNDPELPLQKKEHQAFADHVKLLEKQPLTGENASAMLDEILTYLVRWLYRHILSSDMMIGKMQKEDPFVFTAKYYTGIELVDREHRKLFEIIGEVNALIHKTCFMTNTMKLYVCWMNSGNIPSFILKMKRPICRKSTARCWKRKRGRIRHLWTS